MKRKQLLSVTIITYNEERHIRAALESVAWADEIVVVDSQSSDRTVEICREYCARVVQIPWHGYVKQKNIASQHASHPWVLNIDADEWVSTELAAEIQAILSEEPQAVGFLMPRKTYYLGGWIAHCGWYPDYKLRLYRKDAGAWVGQALHERVQVKGGTARLEHDLYHETYENITDHLEKMNNFTSIAAAQKQGTVTGVGIFLRTFLTFCKKYLLQQGFRDGTRGLIVSLLASFTATLKYAKLWERQQAASLRKEL